MSDSNIGACHFSKALAICVWSIHQRLVRGWPIRGWIYVIYDSGTAGMKSGGLECIVVDVCSTGWQDIAAVEQTIAGFIQPNVWQLFLSLEHMNFVASSPFLPLCPFCPSPITFCEFLCVPSCPVPLRMTLASPCTQKLMTHPELNPASPASSFRPLIWAYYADCGFGHVRSNVLI